MLGPCVSGSSLSLEAPALAHWPADAWHEVLILAALGLSVGALWTLNTWDWPTYAVVVAVALACREYARRRQLSLGMIGAVTWRWADVLALGYVLFLPFHQHYAASYGDSHGGRARYPADRLCDHARPVPLPDLYLPGFELAYGHGHNTLVRLLRAASCATSSRLRRYRRLYRLLVRPSSGYILALRIGALCWLPSSFCSPSAMAWWG